MATIASTEFDGTNGDPANLTSEPIFANRTAPNGWFYRSASKASGTTSIDTVNPAGSTSIWQYTHTGLVSTMYYDICIRVPTLPSAEITVLQLRSGGTNRAQVTITNTGSVRIKNGTTTVDSTVSGFVVADQWFRVKWGISGAAQELRIYNDATPANLFGSSPVDTLQGSYTQGTWDQFRFGTNTAIDVTVAFDRMVIDNSTWPSSGGTGNVPPTANAGPDQDSVTGGALVTLNGTGSSDSDGTIASYSWRQVSGSTVTLSATNVASPTFTAPPPNGSATFGLTVVDNDGASSAEDTVTITWSTQPASNPTSDFYELFQGGTSPTVLTTGNTAFDEVDASAFTFSAAGIADGSGAAQATANNTVKLLHHDLTAAKNEVWADAIFTISDLAAGPWFIMRATGGGVLRATVRVNTDGSIQARNNITAVGTAVGSVTNGVPFRVAWYINNTTTDQYVRVYQGTDLYSDGVPGEFSLNSGNYDQGTVDRISFGIAAPAVTGGGILKVSTVQVDESAWPAPYNGGGGGPSTGTQISEIYQIESDGSFTPMYLDIL